MNNNTTKPKLSSNKKHLNILENSKKEVLNSNSIDNLLDTKMNIPTDLDLSAPTNVEYIQLRKHISYSEIATWMDCAYKHKLKYLDEIKTDNDGPSEHTEFGQAIHDALEQYLATGIMPSSELVAANITELFKQLPHKDELKEAEWQGVVEPILSEVPAFMKEQFGDWKFIASEFPLMESIDNHNHMFKGFIDGVIEYTGKKGERLIFVLDWKTCSYFWPTAKRIDPKKTMQLAFYKYFYSRKFNIPLKDMRCGFVLLRRSKKPGNCELVVVSVGDKAVERALGTIDKMLGYVQKRMFPKSRDACKFCPYANTEHCR